MARGLRDTAMVVNMKVPGRMTCSMAQADGPTQMVHTLTPCSASEESMARPNM
jgi:hypothetical protein